jgi:hypothetical protein
MEKELLIKMAKESKNKWEGFYKKHWVGADELTVVLKGHLFLEQILNEIIILTIPKPQYILDKKFYDKLKIFEALGLAPSNELIEKLLAINTLRNKYSHNLNYKCADKDIQTIVKGLGTSYQTNRGKIIMGFNYAIGYLSALKSSWQVVPFTLFCAEYNNIFKREKAYNVKKITKSIYAVSKVSDIIEQLKL